MACTRGSRSGESARFQAVRRASIALSTVYLRAPTAARPPPGASADQPVRPGGSVHHRLRGLRQAQRGPGNESRREARSDEDVAHGSAPVHRTARESRGQPRHGRWRWPVADGPGRRLTRHAARPPYACGPHRDGRLPGGAGGGRTRAAPAASPQPRRGSRVGRVGQAARAQMRRRFIGHVCRVI